MPPLKSLPPAAASLVLMLFGGFVLRLQAAPADPASYLAGFASVARTEWPDNRTLNIVCHGHSVPAGYSKTPEVDTFNAYPALLHQHVKVTYPLAVINVIVTAVGGEDSVAGAARFSRDVLALHPDVVTIDYALNDRGIGLKRARAAWVSMIRAAQKAGVRVILLTPTGDTAAHPEDPDDPLNQHAEQIRGLAAEHGTGLVDSLALFEQQLRAGVPLADLMAQANHPNRRGHELVAAELAAWFIPTATEKPAEAPIAEAPKPRVKKVAPEEPRKKKRRR